MKRSSTPPPDLPAAARRRRSLSEEERALWESVAKDTKPLRKKPGATKAQANSHAADGPAAVKLAESSLKPFTSDKISQRPAPPPLAPLARRERAHLSRGKKQIDARLDLHGMTQTRAYRELSGFLHRAHSNGLSFVLVITGKGKIGAESERGVLRRQVPQWLALPEFRSLVVGFEQAHIGHGGEGALYVRIRRARN
ncbi:MAG: DNA mismatch repair protein MutS [Alphaproteobacteria bacterium]|jgi:DNA-nicking Smr family endonuclease|nr:MAG: DNA mismatch repair protein MutS [Alphaproteobacteria bacterium]TMJ81555.1 MAG: DNA mismatch repair protein MutS [Alphaproteobacteria bacterium]